MPSPTQSTSATLTNLSGSDSIDSLLHTHKWYSDTRDQEYILTFSFISDQSFFPVQNYDSDINSKILWESVTNFSDIQKASIRKAIKSWSDTSGLIITEVEESINTVGDIRFGLSSNVERLVGEAAAFAYLPDNFYPSAGDIWFNSDANDLIGGYVSSSFANSNFEEGSFAFYIALHEIGHALGLKHPFETSNNSGVILDKNLNDISNTIMSYTHVANDNAVLGLVSYPSSPMRFDIDAINYLYDKNPYFNSGNDEYRFHDDHFFFQTIFDVSGVDTIVYEGNYSMNLDLSPGTSSFLGKRVETYGNGSPESEYEIPNIWLANNIQIENAIGSKANDYIKGNSLDNEIFGSLGNDSIFGEDGNDIIQGGQGSDLINGGSGLDIYKVNGKFEEFNVKKITENSWLLDGDPFEGEDVLTDIERVFFVDAEMDSNQTKVLAFDTDPGETAGQAYRLYQAAFARVPDGPGVGYHVNDMENNSISLYQVANNFLASPEFISKYGADLLDTEFVNLLYQNVLGRTGADFEIDFYINNFARDLSDPFYMDRAMALIGFSESPENVNLVANQIDNGIMFF